MKKWLYVLSVAVIIGSLIFYYLSTQSFVKQLQAQNEALCYSLSKLQAEYDVLQVKYDLLANKHYDVQLNNPTYDQVKASLAEMKGVKIVGNCLEHTQYVQEHFYKEGLQCYVVISNFKNSDGHVTVAFNTTDKGWVYVEPITMLEVPIEVGKQYYSPMTTYQGGVGMTAKDFMDNKTVKQLVIMR